MKHSAYRKAALAVAALLLSVAGVARADVNGNTAASPDPELERQTFKVADGFEVTLFAADPMLHKPININFDPAGRLWVAGSQTYPQVKPGEVPNDKIFVIEDVDGDGKADKSTVFAEGLFLPAGVAPGDGGAYVGASTELLHLKDTDGDGKADQRRVVLSGFGTEDTHHIIHGFRWGPDGRLHFLQGIYIGSRVETPYGTKVLLASGLWRLQPQSLELDVFFSGLVNPWGATWDKWGNVFATDGAGGEGINFAPPGAAFTASPGMDRALKGLNPSSPKYCGLELISGRQFPDDWQGDAITNDFRANRVVRFKLADEGSGFSSKIQKDVITSTDKAFRPIDVKMGPDGALYIADWYNPIIQHGEVDFRDARRDKAHGRIWRLAAKGRPAVERPKLVGASVADLLAQLTAPEQYTRQQAKAVLRERGAKEVKPALAKWVKGLSAKDADVDLATVEALWVYESIDTPEPALLATALKSAKPHVRAAAVRTASHWARKLDNALALLTPFTIDDDARVRLEAVRAMRAIGTPEAVAVAMRALDKPMDPVLDYTLYQTAVDLKAVWLPAFQSGSLNTWANVSHLNFALKAVKSPDALKSLIAQLKGGQVPPAQRKDLYELVGSLGGPADLGVLFAQATDAKNDGPNRAAALRAIERASRQRKAKVEGNASPEALRALIADADVQVAAAALRLAGSFPGAGLRPEMERIAAAPASPPELRLASVTALADLGSEASTFLLGLADAKNPPAVRVGGIVGLATLDAKAAAGPASQLLVTLPADADPAPVMAAFLRREGGAEALAAALADNKLSADVAKLSLRYIQSIGQEVPALSDVLRKASGLAGGARQLSPEEMKQTVADVLAKGDAARGEAIYRGQATACFQCHALAGAGGKLAPDLRAIGATSPLDYLVDSLLDPNKAVKDGFSSLLVATKDGDFVQGIVVREDAKELILRDNIRDQIAIPVDQIKSRKNGGSLMPAGLTDSLTRGEFLDLIRFLSELGKPGPYALPNDRVVRQWYVAQSNPTAGGTPAIASPAYATVAGLLPTADTFVGGNAEAYLSTYIKVAQPGAVRLVLNAAEGVKLNVAGKDVPLAEQGATVDLPAGMHELRVVLNKAQFKSPALRLELADAPGSQAQAQPAGREGKE